MTTTAPAQVATAADTAPTALPSSGFGLKPLSLGLLLQHPFPHRRHLIAPWLRQGEHALLWAPTGVGKTMLGLSLALQVAGGGTLLGWTNKRPSKVLYIDGEMHGEDLKDRLRDLMDSIEGIDREEAMKNLHVLARQMQDANKPFPDLAEAVAPEGSQRHSGQEEVMQIAHAIGADLVILDNVSTLADIKDENEASSMTPVLKFLLRMKQAGLACILVHHANKGGGGYRGSSKLEATFEVTMGLLKEDGMKSVGGTTFRLTWPKWRGKPDPSVRDGIVMLRPDEGGHLKWSTEAVPEDEMEAILEVLRSARCKTDAAVAKALGMSPATLSRRKRDMMKEGRITPDAWEDYLSACDEFQDPANVSEGQTAPPSSASF